MIILSQIFLIDSTYIIIICRLKCPWNKLSRYFVLEVRPGVPGILPKSISENFGISFSDLEKAAALVDILTEISLF